MGNLAVCARDDAFGHVMMPLVTRCNSISRRMRPEWASRTDINKTPISKFVVYRGVINDVTLWPADGNS